ncbi:MAG: N-acetyl-gamma-glutamyl-phosphate reductase [Deltaproteobacteria bacterium]|nr:MAG: N-acetyl-gamma-glutamyl-phosphate reductase [Deltaproteobacteria bacterium]
MLKVGIYGASGYTGQELLRLLLRHPQAEVVALTSRRYAGVPVSDIYPVFVGLTDLAFVDASPEDVAGAADIVFLALPHGVSMAVAPIFLKAGKKVIDLSADFRLHDVATYEKWYSRHTAPDIIKESVYGMPELYGDEIAKARLVANPGCYPTSVILGLAPLLKANWIDDSSIIADSKSGVSGAGREPQVGTLFCEVDEGFKAYKVGEHRHTPEMEQEISILAGCDVRISFTPHLLPITRGILSTIYATLQKDVTTAELIDLYRAFYKGKKFVRVYKAGTFPNISSVRGSNYCDIGLTVDARTRRVIIICAIDNLVKGAAGQAIQNMNLMCGLSEDTGLTMISLFP